MGTLLTAAATDDLTSSIYFPYPNSPATRTYPFNMVFLVVAFLYLSLPFAEACLQNVISDPQLAINSIPFSTRAHWIRQANAALPSPCPTSAFGTVIVNHTVPGLGELVCTGANAASQKGDPTLHGTRLPLNSPSFF